MYSLYSFIRKSHRFSHILLVLLVVDFKCRRSVYIARTETFLASQIKLKERKFDCNCTLIKSLINILICKFFSEVLALLIKLKTINEYSHREIIIYKIDIIYKFIVISWKTVLYKYYVLASIILRKTFCFYFCSFLQVFEKIFEI